MGVNNITIHGRLTANPELKRTPSGISYCGISVAVNRNFKDASGQYQADFFNVDTWRSTAETVSKYFVKGSEIIVNGAMQCERYTDRDGNNRTVWKLVASSIDFCGNKADSANAQMPQFEEIEPDDDVPF